MTDQSSPTPSLRAAAGGTSGELTLDAAKKLYENSPTGMVATQFR